MDRTLSVTIHWKAVEQSFTVVLFVCFDFTQVVILKNLSILVLALSAVKGFKIVCRKISLVVSI